MDDFDEVEDGFDEICNAGTRQTADEEFVAAGGSLPRYRKTELGSPVNGQPIQKLEDRRWTDHLRRHDERDVIRAAKAGDPAAKDRLYRCFNKKLRKIAGNVKYGGPPFSERLSATGVGFFKALRGYNPSCNNGFWAYAAKFVRGAVVDCVHDWHHRGGKGETRDERKERSKHRPIYVQYNGFEGFHYDLEGGEPISAPIAGRIAPDDAELRECDGSGGKVTDADWDRVVAGRAHPSGWWGIRRGRAASFRAEPLKPISRSRYKEDRTRASRFDTLAYVQRRLSRRFINIGRTLGVPRECFGIDENPRRNGGRYPKKIIGTPVFQIPRAAVKATPPLLPLYRKGRLPDWQGPELPLYLEKHPAPDKYKISASARGNAPALGIIGYLAKISDERARRHLKQVDRKAYALELARKDRTVIIHLFARTPMTHCIPINTAATASDSTDWKDYSTRLADAEAAHPPMVWSERDKWGSYRVIDMRPKTYRVHETTSPRATPFHLEQANYNKTAAVAA